MSGVVVRPAHGRDAAELAVILNAIIARGGTTALEVPYSAVQLERSYIGGPDVISCMVAEDGGGRLLGFQALTRHAGLPADWADIATFARQDGKVPGVGRAVFDATLAGLGALALVAINATIRADNTGGLAFYRKMGFVPYDRSPAVPMRDGTRVDRIHHRLDLPSAA